MNRLKNLVCISLILTACNSSEPNTQEHITADIRKEIGNLATLELKDEIESVTYVPLEVTTDDASLIDGVAEYAVSDKYIYILPVKEPDVVLYDRQGKFIKILIRQGQGPGEINGFPIRMQVDERNDRLYIYCTDRIWVYTLEGEFIGQKTHDYQIVFQHLIDKNRFAAISFPYVPFDSGSYGLAIFTESGDTIVMKNDFHSHLVAREKSGFTIGVTTPAYSEQLKSVLFKTGSNDTIFRIANNRIEPACVLNLQNSDNEIIRSLDASDFSSLGKLEGDGDIFVSDMFETSGRYYFRFRYNQEYYTASIDKKSGKTLVEKCVQSGNIYELSDVNLQFGMVGTRSYQNFPVWGRMEGDYLVQVITPYELNLFKDVRSITIPENLNPEEEEGNPIFIFYKIKN